LLALLHGELEQSTPDSETARPAALLFPAGIQLAGMHADAHLGEWMHAGGRVHPAGKLGKLVTDQNCWG
jgi:hypothetical protein